MQDILNNFGIQPVLLAAQIVNFLIIFWLLKRFAYKPILAMLAKRKKLIAEGVENAQKSQDLLQKTLEEEKAVLKKAQIAAQAILTDAQKQAQDTITKAEDDAKLHVAKILEDAKKDIAQQTAEAEEQLSQHTAQLAVALLEKSVADIIDAKTQKEIIARAAKRFKI